MELTPYFRLMTITTRTLNICCFKQNLFTFDHSYVNSVVFVIIFMLDIYVSIAEKICFTLGEFYESSSIQTN